MTPDARVSERVETLAQRIWRLTLAQGRAWRWRAPDGLPAEYVIHRLYRAGQEADIIGALVP